MPSERVLTFYSTPAELMGRLLEAFGGNYAAAADALGTSRAHLYRLVRGGDIRWTTIEKIAAVLGEASGKRFAVRLAVENSDG